MDVKHNPYGLGISRSRGRSRKIKATPVDPEKLADEVIVTICHLNVRLANIDERLMWWHMGSKCDKYAPHPYSLRPPECVPQYVVDQVDQCREALLARYRDFPLEF